jgi:hypothetical protein
MPSTGSLKDIYIDQPGFGRYREVLNRRVSSLKCGKSR